MRIIIIALALLFCTTRTTYAQTKNLDGTWVPVKQEMGGAALPQGAIQKQRLTIQDTTYMMQAESADRGVVRIKRGKMDIYGRDGVNAGKHFTAIYKYEDNLLTICYNLAGDSYPENYDTKGKPLFFLSVFKKDGDN